MSGFVGARARKKRRNIFLTLIFLILLGFFIFVIPELESNDSEIIPNDNIVPDIDLDMTSLASTIEELELSLFQKDQKIKFRDGQIKILKTELKNTQSQLDSAIIEFNDIKNDFNTLSTDNANLVSPNKLKSLQDKFTKLNVQNDNNITTIKKLNKKIDDLNNYTFSIDEKTNDIQLENQKLKKDNKSLFAKNLKLENNITVLKERITQQKNEIELYLQQVKELKDRSHHGS